jgi:hypothetical protein
MIRLLGFAAAGLAIAAAGGLAGANLAVPAPAVHSGCPPRFTGYDLRPTLVDDALAAVRRAAVDHVTETNQGRVTRRTRRNYPALEIVQLGTAPELPGQTALYRIATRRCSRAAARASWAVAFTDTESVMCCLKDVRFAVRLRSGWWVY